MDLNFYFQDGAAEGRGEVPSDDDRGAAEKEEGGKRPSKFHPIMVMMITMMISKFHPIMIMVMMFQGAFSY